MKWYGILSLVFIVFLLAGVVYAGANTDKISIPKIDFSTDNTTPQIKETEFNCAYAYDQTRDIYYAKWNPNISPTSKYNYEVRLEMSEFEDMLVENSCLNKKDEWAHKSKYKNEILGIEEEAEITFDRCVEEYRSKYCIFMDESHGDDYIECQRITYQNALDTCRKYQ